MEGKPDQPPKKARKKKPNLSIQVGNDTTTTSNASPSGGNSSPFQRDDSPTDLSGAWWRNTGYKLPESSFLGAHSTLLNDETPSLFGGTVPPEGTDQGITHNTDDGSGMQDQDRENQELTRETPRSRLQQWFGGQYVGDVRFFNRSDGNAPKRRRRSSSTESEGTRSHIGTGIKRRKDTRSNPFSATNPPLFHYSCCSRAGRRSQNEDRYAVVASALSTEISTMYGLFDGHGGYRSSEHCAENICYMMEDAYLEELNTLSKSGGPREALEELLKQWEESCKRNGHGSLSMSDITCDLHTIDRRYFFEIVIQRCLLELCMRKAFRDTHAQLRQQDAIQDEALPDTSHDGTTAVCALIVQPTMRPSISTADAGASSIVDQMLEHLVQTESHFYPVGDSKPSSRDLYLLCLAHVGDTRAILIQNDGAIRQLTYDHTPDAPPEHERVLASGHELIDNRIDGKLAMSRSLGDSAMGSGVSPEPDFLALLIDPDVECTLVLATDGLWSTMGPEEVARVTFNKEATFDANDSLEWRKHLYSSTFSASYTDNNNVENQYANPVDDSYHRLPEERIDQSTPELESPAFVDEPENGNKTPVSQLSPVLDSRTISERLVAEALLRGTTDDVTVLVVDLRTRKISRSSASGSSHTSLSPRTSSSQPNEVSATV
eukprot:gb/GECG01007355.1/.p1 GENE.gb/GECG01007355.1/~~gb/GECG01007355.1/.p1  ORF type:complete len:661 (+),score=76.75 gb/GECG01007355.1/:1-1983(+)